MRSTSPTDRFRRAASRRRRSSSRSTLLFGGLALAFGCDVGPVIISSPILQLCGSVGVFRAILLYSAPPYKLKAEVEGSFALGASYIAAVVVQQAMFGHVGEGAAGGSPRWSC